MNIANLLIGTGILLAPLASQAGVIYEWRAENNEKPYSFFMQMEFTKSAIDRGSFSMLVEHDVDLGADPDSELLFLSWGFNGPYGEYTYRPRESGFYGGYGALDMDIEFGHWGIRSGRINLHGMLTSFRMSGDGIFTISQAAGDGGLGGSGCYFDIGYENCHGAQGLIKQVPEPQTFALMALGLAAVAAARRRRA